MENPTFYQISLSSTMLFDYVKRFRLYLLFDAIAKVTQRCLLSSKHYTDDYMVEKFEISSRNWVTTVFYKVVCDSHIEILFSSRLYIFHRTPTTSQKWKQNGDKTVPLCDCSTRSSCQISFMSHTAGLNKENINKYRSMYSCTMA